MNFFPMNIRTNHRVSQLPTLCTVKLLRSLILQHNVHTYVYAYIHIRGTPISKLTDIPITDTLAIKSIDSDTDTNITTSMGSSLLLLQMLQI